jgi:hypothetical protein
MSASAIGVASRAFQGKLVTEPFSIAQTRKSLRRAGELAIIKSSMVLQSCVAEEWERSYNHEWGTVSEIDQHGLGGLFDFVAPLIPSLAFVPCE